MPVGKCPLCLRENQKLQDSHYFPRAAYKLFRAKKLRNPNPVVLSHMHSRQSSSQARDFVFCWDCEQLLNREGENWVIPQLASESGFPLLKRLRSASAAIPESGLKVYSCAKIVGIDCDKLAHFGMGMFWKGHAHRWPNCERLRLGAYGELIRKFLRRQGAFPENVVFFVQVADMEAPPLLGRLPNLCKKQPCHIFNFYLAGIDFSLAVGRGIPHYFRGACFCHNPARPIVVGAHVGPDEIGLAGRVWRKSQPSQKLTEFLRIPMPRTGQS